MQMFFINELNHYKDFKWKLSVDKDISKDSVIVVFLLVILGLIFFSFAQNFEGISRILSKNFEQMRKKY